MTWQTPICRVPLHRHSARGPRHRAAARALRPLPTARQLPPPAAVGAALLRPAPRDAARARRLLGAPAARWSQRRTARVAARRAPVLYRHAR